MNVAQQRLRHDDDDDAPSVQGMSASMSASVISAVSEGEVGMHSPSDGAAVPVDSLVARNGGGDGAKDAIDAAATSSTCVSNGADVAEDSSDNED